MELTFFWLYHNPQPGQRPCRDVLSYDLDLHRLQIVGNQVMAHEPRWLKDSRIEGSEENQGSASGAMLSFLKCDARLARRSLGTTRILGRLPPTAATSRLSGTSGAIPRLHGLVASSSSSASSRKKNSDCLTLSARRPRARKLLEDFARLLSV
jgi:hypothetical protein